MVRELARKRITKSDRDLSLFDFVVHERLGIPAIIAYLNRWHSQMGRLEHCLLLKYEDLRAEPEPQFRRVMDFIGEDLSCAEIAAAVEFASFDNMKRREAENFFNTDRLQPGRADSPDSFKVRRGKVGGYHDYFTAEEVARIDALVEQRLNPSFNYGEPDEFRS
jgi:hypothetical protein